MTTEYVYLCSCCGVAVPSYYVWFRRADEAGMPFCKPCVRGGVEDYCHTPREAIAIAALQGIHMPPGGEWGR